MAKQPPLAVQFWCASFCPLVAAVSSLTQCPLSTWQDASANPLMPTHAVASSQLTQCCEQSTWWRVLISWRRSAHVPEGTGVSELMPPALVSTACCLLFVNCFIGRLCCVVALVHSHATSHLRQTLHWRCCVVVAPHSLCAQPHWSGPHARAVEGGAWLQTIATLGNFRQCSCQQTTGCSAAAWL